MPQTTYTAHATMRNGTARPVQVKTASEVDARRRMFGDGPGDCLDHGAASGAPMSAAVLDFRAVRPCDRLDSSDRAARYADAFERAKAAHTSKIHESFTLGFSGKAVKLPDAYLCRDGVWVRTDHTPFASAAQEACDNEIAFSALLQACRARREGRDADACRLLDTFMTCCADAYSAEHASDLTKAQRDEEIAEAGDLL